MRTPSTGSSHWTPSPCSPPSRPRLPPPRRLARPGGRRAPAALAAGRPRQAAGQLVSQFSGGRDSGAGKTTFALTAARRALVARAIRRIVIVVPTQHLKHQWAQAAERLDIHLDPEWSVGYGSVPSDVHGVVVTYQQVAVDPRGLPAPSCATRWSCSTKSTTPATAAPGATASARPSTARGSASACRARRSGRTRWRSPSSNTSGDLAQPDYEYGYGDALKDQRVVRPVYFPRINGRMGRRPTATATRRPSTIASRASWRASGCARRSTSRANGCRTSSRRPTRSCAT